MRLPGVAGARTEPVDGRLLPTGVADVGDSTVIITCDVTEPCDDIRFRPAPELELPVAGVCLGELKVDDMMPKGVVGECGVPASDVRSV